MSAVRSRARNTITFEPAITGPTGSQILAYTWAWKAIEVVDSRGEESVRRVSDWERAVPSEETGREVVHQFAVRCPLGHEQTVSLESALRATGLLGEKAAPGRGAISAAQTLARLRMAQDALRATFERVAAVEAEVAALPRPQLPTTVDSDGWARLPDFPDVRVGCRLEGLTQERLRCLLDVWSRQQVHTLLRANGCTEVRDARQLRDELSAFDSRIAKAEGKLAVAAAAACPGAVGAVLNKKTHGVPAGAVYIGRPSPYGNPFEIGRHGDRETVVAKYRDWLSERPALVAQALRELPGKALVCWCAPAACHGHVLREVVNARAGFDASDDRAPRDTQAPGNASAFANGL